MECRQRVKCRLQIRGKWGERRLQTPDLITVWCYGQCEMKIVDGRLQTRIIKQAEGKTNTADQG